MKKARKANQEEDPAAAASGAEGQGASAAASGAEEEGAPAAASGAEEEGAPAAAAAPGLSNFWRSMEPAGGGSGRTFQSCLEKSLLATGRRLP